MSVLKSLRLHPAPAGIAYSGLDGRAGPAVELANSSLPHVFLVLLYDVLRRAELIHVSFFKP